MRRATKKVLTRSVAHFLDCTERGLQGAVIVDVEVIRNGRERAGLVENNFAVAGKAVERISPPKAFGDRRLAGAEDRPSCRPCPRRAPTGLHICPRSSPGPAWELVRRPVWAGGGRRRRGRHADILGRSCSQCQSRSPCLLPAPLCRTCCRFCPRISPSIHLPFTSTCTRSWRSYCPAAWSSAVSFPSRRTSVGHCFETSIPFGDWTT